MADRLGKYEVRGTLGKGASGIVYEGWDPHIARLVAIKTSRLPERWTPSRKKSSPGSAARRRPPAGCTHPNIVGVFDYGETASSPTSSWSSSTASR